MLCQLPRWHLCPDRQLLSLTQIHLPPGKLLEIRSPAQFKSVSRWSCPRSGVELPSLSTLEAALSQNLGTTVPSHSWAQHSPYATSPGGSPNQACVALSHLPREPLRPAGFSTPACSQLAPKPFSRVPPHSRAPRGPSPAYLPGWTAPSCCLGWPRASSTGIIRELVRKADPWAAPQTH